MHDLSGVRFPPIQQDLDRGRSIRVKQSGEIGLKVNPDNRSLPIKKIPKSGARVDKPNIPEIP
jgi:hypothetical protein